MNFVNYTFEGDYTCILTSQLYATHLMAETHNIATLNISGAYSGHKKQMLRDFVQHNNIDLLLVHEVSTESFSAIPGYQIYYNIGTMGPGTAIKTRDTIPLQRLKKLPSDSGTGVANHDTHFVKIYAPSGNNKRQEMDAFCNAELTYLLRRMPQHCFLGSNCNCVTSSHNHTNDYQQHT